MARSKRSGITYLAADTEDAQRIKTCLLRELPKHIDVKVSIVLGDFAGPKVRVRTTPRNHALVRDVILPQIEKSCRI